MPPNTVKVDRTTKWGNPFRLGETHVDPKTNQKIVIDSREAAVAAFKELLRSNRVLLEEARFELKGKHLACWCRAEFMCHADELLRQVNG